VGSIQSEWSKVGTIICTYHYQDAIFPGWWMNEGGQSSTGQLIDFVLKTHPSYVKLQQLAETKKISIYECKKVNVFYLCMRLSSVVDLAAELQRQMSETNCKSATELTRHLHFYPDLHGINWNIGTRTVLTPVVGNRSPLADPRMRGSITGLTLVNQVSID
jgi:ribulose kinase